MNGVIIPWYNLNKDVMLVARDLETVPQIMVAKQFQL